VDAARASNEWTKTMTTGPRAPQREGKGGGKEKESEEGRKRCRAGDAGRRLLYTSSNKKNSPTESRRVGRRRGIRKRGKEGVKAVSLAQSSPRHKVYFLRPRARHSRVAHRHQRPCQLSEILPDPDSSGQRLTCMPLDDNAMSMSARVI
jgi:hypothetical protein